MNAESLYFARLERRRQRGAWVIAFGAIVLLFLVIFGPAVMPPTKRHEQKRPVIYDSPPKAEGIFRMPSHTMQPDGRERAA